MARFYPYKRSRSALADQLYSHRCDRREVAQARAVAAEIIGAGCEPSRTPEADYLQGVVLAAAGFAPLPVSDR